MCIDFPFYLCYRKEQQVAIMIKGSYLKEILIQDVATVQPGYHAQTAVSEDPNGSYRLLQSKDLDINKHFEINYLTCFTPKRKPQLYLIRKGDVLFQSRGTAHFALHLENDLKNVLAGGSFYILRVKTTYLLPSYLAWWLNQSRAQAYFRLHARESRISFIPKSALMNLPIKIPSLGVQEKITTIVKLQKRERILLDQLHSVRARLIEAVCAKSILNDEPRNIQTTQRLKKSNKK